MTELGSAALPYWTRPRSRPYPGRLLGGRAVLKLTSGSKVDNVRIDLRVQRGDAEGVEPVWRVGCESSRRDRLNSSGRIRLLYRLDGSGGRFATYISSL